MCLMVSVGVFTYFPRSDVFLSLNLASLLLIFIQVFRGRPWTTKHERSFLLSSALVIMLALYGSYRTFGKLDLIFYQNFFLLPAISLYFTQRFFVFHYNWLLALDYASSLGPEGKLDFADMCRTKYRKQIAALPVAAELYKMVGKEAMEKGTEIKPYHIIAMQKYAHMLLYGEAKGLINEGEWFARKAHQFSVQLLIREEAEAEATMH